MAEGCLCRRPWGGAARPAGPRLRAGAGLGDKNKQHWAARSESPSAPLRSLERGGRRFARRWVLTGRSASSRGQGPGAMSPKGGEERGRGPPQGRAGPGGGSAGGGAAEAGPGPSCCGSRPGGAGPEGCATLPAPAGRPRLGAFRGRLAAASCAGHSSACAACER